MALTRTVDENGKTIAVHSDGGHVVLTGPIQGTVVLADGTEVDVSPDFVEVESAEHAAEVAHLVGERYADEGHPNHGPDDEPFVHIPVEG